MDVWQSPSLSCGKRVRYKDVLEVRFVVQCGQGREPESGSLDVESMIRGGGNLEDGHVPKHVSVIALGLQLGYHAGVLRVWTTGKSESLRTGLCQT